MIKQIIIIILIFVILILGQQTYFKNLGSGLYKKAEGWGRDVWQKIVSFWESNVLRKLTGEIDKRQDIAKQEIKEQTKQVGQNIWEKIGGYITNFFNNIFSSVSLE